MSNYKLEVENTEKLKSDINSAFTEINTELKKNDNLIASDLFDVDKCIEELKKSRKRWASGESCEGLKLIIIKQGSYERQYLRVDISKLNLSFVPTKIICLIDRYPISIYDDKCVRYEKMANGYGLYLQTFYPEKENDIQMALSGELKEWYAFE